MERVRLGTESPVRRRRERGCGSSSESGATARLALRPLTAAPLLVLAGLLFLPAPAEAQTQIWSATLNPGNTGAGEAGCDHSVAASQCSNTSLLTDDDFNYGGINYAFTRIELRSGTPGRLTVEWDPDLPATVTNLILRIGSTDFPFADADQASDGLRRWDDLKGVSWFATGQSIKLIRVDAGSATLSGLTIENAANNAAIRFNETFASTTTSYTASVANSVTQITVKPTKYDSNATITYLDASNSPIPDVGGRGEVGPQVQLRLGSNTIKVRVTAQGNVATQTYTIEVLRRQHISCRRSSADWCSMMAVEAKAFDARPAGTFYGYRAVGRYGDGLLDDDIIEYRDQNNQVVSVGIGEIGLYDYDQAADLVAVGFRQDWLPDGTVFNIGGTSFEAAKGRTTIRGLYQWPRPRGFNLRHGRWVTVSARVRYARLSVGDAEATEGDDESLDFVVTLSPAASDTVTVAYETSDGTATAGSDFEQTNGVLTFAPGETTMTISVPIIDDDVEDDGETVNLELIDPVGADIGDGTAVGTIRNTEAATDASDALTAAFWDVPAEHDGSTSFTVKLAFSEELASGSGRKVAAGLTLTGARRGHVTRVANGRDLFSFPVHPSGNGAVTLSLSASATDCAASSAVCTADGRMLSAAVSAAVQGPREPLTVVFQDVPDEHDGSTSFTVKLAFSEELASGSGRKAASALTLTGARSGYVTRVAKGRDLFSFPVHPSGNGAVTLSLSASATDCSASSAVCTADGRMLSASVSASVQGPPGLSVEDAEVDEGDNAQLSFKVKLGRTASDTVTVKYATSDVTATAGEDYRSANGTLSFAAGETEKTLTVTVLEDSHNDDGETLTLTLSNASGAYLADATATGTIHNSDPLPRALMARFGRAAAVHVVEHVEERLQAPREPGFRGRLAGRELQRGMERDMALGFLQGLGSLAGHEAGAGLGDPRTGAAGAAGLPGMPGVAGGGLGLAAGGGLGAGAGLAGFGMTGSGLGMAGSPGSLGRPGMAGAVGPGPAPGGSTEAGPGPGPLGGRLLSMGIGGGDPLTGSAFALNRETHGGMLSFWSRGAQSHFSGREGELSLGGDVRTTMFGADYARGPVVAGLSLSHSRGLGEYAGASGGEVASAVTGLYPWLGYKATERVTVWGVAGYGIGAMLLTPAGGPTLEAGLSMAMAAAGTRGELVAGGAGGFELAFKADALWVGTGSDGVDGPTGRLAATEAAVTRVRTGLEGSRAYTLAGRLSLRPVVEVGLRHDDGDAETGAGMDVGGGLVASDPASGLAVDVRVRTLVVHQAEGFRERAVALSVSYTPTPSTPLGFTAKVAPSWGGQATSGAEALWGRETMAGVANGGTTAGDRLDAEVGYGLPVGSRFVGTPRVGVATSEYGRYYRLGYGMTMLQARSTQLNLGIDAQRRESPLQGGTSHGVLGRATVGW